MIMISNVKDLANRCWSVKELDVLDKHEQKLILKKINLYLESLSIENRIIWAFQYLPERLILSSSFGAQSSVSLHLITRFCPNIPIVLIDTGYLFPETYQFIDRLTEKMKLNLHVFRSFCSPAWQEARYGELWKQGVTGIQKYNSINKIEPMRRALENLKVNTWFSGLRRSQSDSRKNLLMMTIQSGIFKFLPIIDWNNHQVHQYITEHNLEYHPLWTQGYVSIGDIHTTKKWKCGIKEEETRFFGLHRECGLHLFD